VPTFHEDWFSDASCEALANLAQQTNHLPGIVLELGSWEGRSTVALAAAVKPAVVRAVDTWRGSEGEISELLAQERDVFATFQANTNGLNVQPYRMDWREYFAVHPERIRLAFVDALHTYEEVRDQIATIVPLMVPGGICAAMTFTTRRFSVRFSKCSPRRRFDRVVVDRTHPQEGRRRTGLHRLRPHRDCEDSMSTAEGEGSAHEAGVVIEENEDDDGVE
jgi:hypothetical protein